MDCNLTLSKDMDLAAVRAMKPLVFDSETNGLVDSLDKIHCISIKVLGSDEFPELYTGRRIFAALHRLEKAEAIIAHNAIGFDVPAIQKVYPNWKPKGIVVDSLVLSRLVFQNIKEMDWALGDRCPVPKNVRAPHSLEAWGYRLKMNKGDYKKEMEEQGLDPWAEMNEAMGDYCNQDVVLLDVLMQKLIERGCFDNPLAWTMEMKFHQLMLMQEKHGIHFDVRGAQDLAAKLGKRRDELLGILQEQFPPIEPKLIGVYGGQRARAWRLMELEGDMHPAWEPAEAARGWLMDQGIKFRWTKRRVFNPNSELQVAERFLKMGWKPERYTKTGQPKQDEEALIDLGKKIPEGKHLVEFGLLSKRLGQISEGKQAWLTKVGDDERIHGRINSMGCVSFRCSHSSPNTAQVPAVYSPYGKECRELWQATPGWVLVGADASGIELRVLGHYLAPMDNGKFAAEVVDGDIHTSNQKMTELATRDQAKTFIYAHNYGAGDAKLGSIAGKGKAYGKAMRAKFLRRMPAMARLIKGVRAAVTKTKRLKAIDGRVLHVRSAHSAFNLLLQSAGGILCKLAAVILWEHLEKCGLEFGMDYAFVLNVHDEWQIECRPAHVELIKKESVLGFESAGRMLSLRVVSTGEAKHGQTWAETH